MKVVKTKGFLKKLSIIFMLLILIIASYLSIKQPDRDNTILGGNSELLRAMTYDQFEDGDEKVEGTDNVEFSAFFLRDVDGDGYADKLKGTCKEIGKEDTLYMEVIVKTAGYLKDGKIEIDGKNFYLQTSLPKDTELLDNYISNNIKTIEFENLNNGTQKLLTGVTRSGDYSYTSKELLALKNDTSNYSRDDNVIILTGTYVDDGGNEMPIRKEISLTVDWYGAARTEFLDRSQTYHNLSNIIHEDTQEIELSFRINPSEVMTELLLSKNYVEGTIPELNGYSPIDVTCDSKNVEYTYDADTRVFTITKEAQKNSEEKITANAYEDTLTNDNKVFCRYNSYAITVKYPIEAYQSLENDFVSISIPVKSYYEGYNNPNDEFVNPYRSDMTLDTIIAEYTKPVESSSSLEISVGKSVYISSINDSKKIVSKLKPMRIFNGISAEEKNDIYDVIWKVSTGTQSQQSGLTLKETRTGENQVSDTFIKSNFTEENMENITANIGIGFYISGKLLNDDGYIKVYDEETGNLVETFTKNGSDGSKKWDNYTKANYYKYNTPIKHIRVETSEANSKCSLYIYNIKELDDAYITDNYTREEFDNLKYIKSNVVAYLGENINRAAYSRAFYEEPYSLATISTNKNVLSTQSTEKNFILNIDALNDEEKNQSGWTNGSFLVKLPDEILDLHINSVESNKESVKITSYEVIKINGCNFIRVKTNNNNPDEYRIVINVDITPDPRIATINSSIKLYAVNEETDNYELKSNDIYDIDNDGNIEEKINYRSIDISLISPNSLLTNQTMSEFDQSGEVVVSPQVVDLKPIYNENDREKQTVKVGIQIRNNYSGTISETQILGKIPFEGNSYVISGKDLNSKFSTQMKNTGIQIPEELQSKATIYYSENSDPNRLLDDSENGWTLKENVSDWSKIKCYLIDLGDLVIDVGQEYTFYYVVEIPFGVEFNKVAYSHHGVYFTLDVPEGKYKTNTEPNRIGVRIADKYDLLLNKYQINTNKIVNGATYKVSKINSNGIIESSKTAITNNNGMLEMANLYAEEIYEISEIESPENYALNGDTIKIIGHIDRTTGVLSVEKLRGVLRDEIEIIKNREQDYKANLQVEDEVKASVNIIKTDRDTGLPVKRVKYNITGKGLDLNGKTITTDTSGQASIKGIEIGEEYTLSEVRAEGYYIPSPIKIKIVNNNGTYLAEIIEGDVKNSRIIMSDDLPILNLEIEDEMIPRYNLEITKIKSIAKVETDEQGSSNNEEITYLKDARFKLYKNQKEIGTYVTDSNGKLVIENLYAYEESKNVNQDYVLKEIEAPEGYVSVKDITFKVKKDSGELVFIEQLQEGQNEKQYSVDENTVKLTIEDSPTFKLVKKDSETGAPIEGVKFAFYNIDNIESPARNSKGEIVGTKEIVDNQEYYVLNTDSHGEISIDLPEGQYKAIEVKSDEKYELPNKAIYFGINAKSDNRGPKELDYAKTIGSEKDDRIMSVCTTKDGGYVVVGYFNSENISEQNITITNHSTYTDGFIFKYNMSGKIEYGEAIGGNGTDQLLSVCATKDGGFVAVGYFTQSITIGNNVYTSNGSNDAIIIKYDTDNEVEWVKTIGGTSLDYLTSVKETKDGGVIIGGYYYSKTLTVGDDTFNHSASNGSKGLIIKCNQQGEFEWSDSLYLASQGYSDSHSITSVCEIEDGKYVAVGKYEKDIKIGDIILTTDGGFDDGFIVEYNHAGEVEYADAIGGTNSDYLTTICATSDGGYLIGGYIRSSEFIFRNQTFIRRI